MLKEIRRFIGVVTETEAKLLRDENGKLRQTINELKLKNADLNVQLTELDEENGDLLDDYDNLRCENEMLSERIEQLEEDTDERLIARNKELQGKVYQLAREVDSRDRRICELEREFEVLESWNLQMMERLKEICAIDAPTEEKDADAMAAENAARAQKEIERNRFVIEEDVCALELSARTYNGLKRRGINTIFELLNHQMSDLLDNTRNFGKASANELYLCLVKNELSLREDDKITQRRIERILLPAMKELAKK